MLVAELCRKHVVSKASYYLRRSRFGGVSVSDAKQFNELETEDTRLKSCYPRRCWRMRSPRKSCEKW